MKKAAESIRRHFLDRIVMDMNEYQQNSVDALFEKLIVYINAMHEISELSSSNKDTLIQDQGRQLVECIDDFNQEFETIETEEWVSLITIITDGTILAGYSFKPEENPDFDSNRDFNKLKKDARGIRGYFLHPMVMATNFYQQEDIVALYEKLIVYINAMQQISKLAISDKDALILVQVRSLVEYINEFNQQFGAIETDDREHIGEIIDVGAILAGYSVKPEENPYFDITREWRKW